jgi:hypothetical protein
MTIAILNKLIYTVGNERRLGFIAVTWIVSTSSQSTVHGELLSGGDYEIYTIAHTNDLHIPGDGYVGFGLREPGARTNHKGR